MKIYDIVLMVLVFNIALSLMTAADIFGSVSPQCMASTTWINSFQATSQEDIDLLPNVPGTQVSDWFFGIIKGLAMLKDVVWNATFNLPGLMSNCLYMDSTTAATISIGIWFVYVVGIIQFISGRAFNQME